MAMILCEDYTGENISNNMSEHPSTEEAISFQIPDVWCGLFFITNWRCQEKKINFWPDETVSENELNKLMLHFGEIFVMPQKWHLPLCHNGCRKPRSPMVQCSLGPLSLYTVFWLFDWGWMVLFPDLLTWCLS